MPNLHLSAHHRGRLDDIINYDKSDQVNGAKVASRRTTERNRTHKKHKYSLTHIRFGQLREINREASSTTCLVDL